MYSAVLICPCLPLDWQSEDALFEMFCEVLNAKKKKIAQLQDEMSNAGLSTFGEDGKEKTLKAGTDDLDHDSDSSGSHGSQDTDEGHRRKKRPSKRGGGEGGKTEKSAEPMDVCSNEEPSASSSQNVGGSRVAGNTSSTKEAEAVDSILFELCVDNRSSAPAHASPSKKTGFRRRVRGKQQEGPGSGQTPVEELGVEERKGEDKEPPTDTGKKKTSQASDEVNYLLELFE